MAVELRPATAVLVLVAVLAAGSVGSIVVAEADSSGDDETLRSITLEGEDRHLWLFTSRGRTFDQPTLSVNVLVYGDPEDVRRRLVESNRGNWNETGAGEQEVAVDESASALNSTSVEWQVADGADRYVYLSDVEGGAWLSEDYQIHDGSYLGSRHHVRAYTPPGDDASWTAMQAHHEHWDWFMGQHIVTSVGDSQSYLEREFVDNRDGPAITRVPTSSGDHPGFDRWLTVVDFRNEGVQSAAVLAVVLLGAFRTRVADAGAALADQYPEADARAFVLAAGVGALFVSVRLAGIALERSLDLPPKGFAFLLYPVLFVGLPVTAYLLAGPLDRARAFGGASLGFIAAVLVDYTYLGVANIPLDVLVHRGALAVALGLVAVGGSRGERRDPEHADHVRSGVLLWLVATVLPLLRHTPLPV
ncbi:hypothetical protein [Halobacterium wangiae]|uniref:hypothetical protein n=1 Tax=Halobacterium wangiae TaxID=2902623 RepID=UPI001E52C68E|nr:hypothetical protein [Halobacterium wangiae]